ncbi:glutathione S-transferase family protein [uncultured Roseobacter sp.]|uniref:glutathione S-transferase family protein n=1 Tax=uncultured Roseobacter sp. TaxID=114847 RepID=UPI00262584C5|nr:glutathione S-transferase family protein [uncultured Roseobacter sp.]
MINLLTYPAAFGQFSSSPFCTKAAWLLNLSGQMWRREDTLDPRMMPYSKLPVIRVEDRLIADSDGIRAHLESNGADFDRALTEEDRAVSRAFIRMSEEHMYFHLVLDRWGNPDIWPVVRETYFAGVPRLIRPMVTRQLRAKVLAGMKTQGLGRLDEVQRLNRIEPDIAAITTRLRHRDFLFGDRPSAADTSVAPVLSAIRATPGTTLLKRFVEDNAILTGYLDRCARTMG